MLPWKIFEKTGNVEAYLLMKQVEGLNERKNDQQLKRSNTLSSVNPKT
ncbi:YqzL family protein [Alkalibacillus aidingensis]|nr:YqzL family protein [Alkalibacillus aidingensis]